ERLQQLSDNYIELKETIKKRREHLELLENIHQYYYDLSVVAVNGCPSRKSVGAAVDSPAYKLKKNFPNFYCH
ncbi:unnamed protein product, partial [Rotaria socialis]